MALGPPLSLIPVTGIGEVEPGTDLVALISDACGPDGIEPYDVVVVTHKIVSKAEGALAAVAVGDPDAHRAIVEREAVSIVRRRGDLVIARTRHGFICANAGVDRSNVRPGQVVLLPTDPDRSAHRLRLGLEARYGGGPLAVIVTDTFGRPWRRGLTDVAIGVSGMDPVVDHRGTTDTFGSTLEVTEVAVVDELAAAADLVMGKATAIPVAIVRGLAWTPGEGRVADMIRPDAEDLFR